MKHRPILAQEVDPSESAAYNEWDTLRRSMLSLVSLMHRGQYGENKFTLHIAVARYEPAERTRGEWLDRDQTH